jgi:hypothetical protein
MVKNNGLVKNFTKKTRLNHIEEKRVQCKTTINKPSQKIKQHGKNEWSFAPFIPF